MDVQHDFDGAASRHFSEPEDWHFEVEPLTFGRSRINWTDGRFIDAFW